MRATRPARVLFSGRGDRHQQCSQMIDTRDLIAAAGSPLAPAAVAVEWRIADAPVPYPAARAAMEARVTAITAGEARKLVWLIQHPPLYTAGTSAGFATSSDGVRF
jgi:lipoate-protein ligase B